MHKCERIKKLIDIYMIMVLIGILLWIPFPEFGNVIGASSLIHSFLLVVGDTTKWIKCLSLIWILTFCLLLVGSYIVARKTKKYKMIIWVSGIELLIAGIIIFYIFFTGYYYNIISILIGYIIRFLYFMLMVFNYAAKHRHLKA